jgi:hypothetical protein
MDLHIGRSAVITAKTTLKDFLSFVTSYEFSFTSLSRSAFSSSSLIFNSFLVLIELFVEK